MVAMGRLTFWRMANSVMAAGFLDSASCWALSTGTESSAASLQEHRAEPVIMTRMEIIRVSMGELTAIAIDSGGAVMIHLL